ncbi:hypothetical protein [Pseudomonas abietaniphila]|jgi:hypothetical protein|uniref:Uncharacterized protein n=1 Tax=Pseudomonas abietaniphila TaxID=89065 RepID=A0A1G8DK93_9PSED|nr:hypothetical protein [Pseudomonas abietaniphila]SDH57810.1 hypothetical protein SAMN05216605_10764 [Pseudomonas abietaniphila]
MNPSEKNAQEMKRSLSDFVRNATSEEKERVYQEVMKKAWERQDRIIEKARNM